MKDTKRVIYVCCPANSHTGGPTLAHQLCYKLREQGHEAVMFYYPRKKGVSPVHEHYAGYGLPYVDKIEDKPQNIMIVPESKLDLLRFKRSIKKVIWWMSVDFYLRYMKYERRKFRTLFGLCMFDIRNKNIFHFAQCYYAQDFLKQQGVEPSRIFYLSDYLSHEFIADSLGQSLPRRDTVLYNPKKGLEFTQLIIDRAKDLQWVPLINLTPAEMAEQMRSGKVYIDFGNHPGKDRIPREAAISGCCVITGRRGSANYAEDVFIPEEFKFEDRKENIDAIVAAIRKLLAGYDEYTSLYEPYRERIKNEERQFDEDVKRIFSVL